MSGAGFPQFPSNPNDNDSALMIATTVAVTTLALFTVVTRFYVRTTMVRALGWDDWFMGLAMLVSISTQVVVILAVKHGAAQHIGDVPLEIYSKGTMFNFVSTAQLLWGICLVKLSVGFALLRIAARKTWRVVIIGFMSFMFVYTIGCFVSNFFFCERLSMLWDFSPDAPPRNCWAPSTLAATAFTHAGLNIVTDFAFAIAIPIPMLWKLQLNGRNKAAIMFVLSLGVFVCLAGILRIPEILNFGKQGDFLWSNRIFTIWFMTEMNTGIIAGSIPALKPLFKSVLDRAYTFSNRRSTKITEDTTNATAESHHLRNVSKGSNKFHDVERHGSYTRFDDADSAASQRKLVLDGDDGRLSPRGVIQKSVTTTVTALPDNDQRQSNTGRRGW